LISVEDTMEGEEGEQRKKLLIASHLNRAMCHLKMNHNEDAIESCDEALKLDANNEKGLFRRGTAHMNMRNYELAVTDFKATIRVDPANKMARNNLSSVQNTLREMKEREKQTYKGMFDKFAQQDSKKDQCNTEKNCCTEADNAGKNCCAEADNVRKNCCAEADNMEKNCCVKADKENDMMKVKL